MEKIVSLPFPTNSTQKGPIIFADSASLQLKYDFEKNDGAIEWTEIEFTEVLAYRFHQSICADMGSNLDANKIQEFDTSAWLSATVDKWDQTVGWQKYQMSLGGRSRFKHYLINFDDVGVFEVVCSRFRII